MRLFTRRTKTRLQICGMSTPVVSRSTVTTSFGRGSLRKMRIFSVGRSTEGFASDLLHYVVRLRTVLGGECGAQFIDQNVSVVVARREDKVLPGASGGISMASVWATTRLNSRV